ncbi:MAG: hypothetical protein GY765_43600, partial [bacterium]|nr:hypothetical protein [bacterium]
EDISIGSVKKTLEKRIMKQAVMTLAAENLKGVDTQEVVKAIEETGIVIATPVIINPFFRQLFDAVVYIRPESYFSIDEYDAAEMIFSTLSEMKELLKAGGEVDVFSTFHFHYSMKLINREDDFFTRELKYREWFHLPPFFYVYNIEVKDKDLRKLAKEMRDIYGEHKDLLKIKKAYLSGRKPVRGVVKGILEVHARPEVIRGSGLLGKRNIQVNLEML